MFSFHRLIHVKVKYFSRNTPPLHFMLHAFLPSNIGGKVYRVKREGLGLYVDDVPLLQFTLLWVPPRIPQGIPGAYNSSIAVVEGGGGERRAALWCRQTWSICLFFLASLFSFMLILTISCPVDLNCSAPLVAGISLIYPVGYSQAISNSEHLNFFYVCRSLWDFCKAQIYNSAT